MFIEDITLMDRRHDTKHYSSFTITMEETVAATGKENKVASMVRS
jgi:hypothetical protein